MIDTTIDAAPPSVYTTAGACAAPFFIELRRNIKLGDVPAYEFYERANDILDQALATAYAIEANVAKGELLTH